MSPWGVRALLCRLNKTARRLGYQVDVKNKLTADARAAARAAREAKREASAERARLRAERAATAQARRDQHLLEQAAARAARHVHPQAAENKKETRDRYRREGKCTRCGRKRETAKWLTCEKCRAYARDFARATSAASTRY